MQEHITTGGSRGICASKDASDKLVLRKNMDRRALYEALYKE